MIGNVNARGVGEMIVNDGGGAPVLTSSAAKNLELIPEIRMHKERKETDIVRRSVCRGCVGQAWQAIDKDNAGRGQWRRIIGRGSAGQETE